MNKFKKIIISTQVFFLLNGCVIFKGNNLQKIELNQLEESSTRKKKIYVHWEMDFFPIAHSNINYVDREVLFKQALKDSKCCELVKKKSEADLIFEGKAYDQRNPARFVGFLISAFTAYIIPSWHVAKIFVTAEVKEGEKTFHYEVADSMTTVIWLPLVIATPFAYNFDKTHKDILENSYRSVLLKMKNDLLFTKNNK
jgi:hypothetical protein